MPYGLKDIIDYAGLPTTAHSAILKDTIETKSKALAEASNKLAEKAYAQEQAKQQAASGAAGSAGAAGGGAPGGAETKAEAGKKDDSNVVDAEFTEVKDKK